MLSNSLLKNSILLLLFSACQILIFNQLQFLSLFFPMIYILWIYQYPLEDNPYIFLFLSFILGLSIDLFIGTGGIHAFASVSIAFLRKPLFGIISSSSDNELIGAIDQKLNKFQNFILIFFLILIHHSFLYLIDNLKFSNYLILIQRIIINSLITFTFVYSFYLLFIKSRNE
jgi:hypothetical protein